MSDRRPQPQKRHGDRVALNPRQLQRILDGRDNAIAGTIDALTRRVEALEKRHAERTWTTVTATPQSMSIVLPQVTTAGAITKVTWWTRLRSLFSRA